PGSTKAAARAASTTAMRSPSSGEMLRGRPAVLLQDASEVSRVSAGDDERQPQAFPPAVQLDGAQLAIGHAHTAGVGEAVVDREPIPDAEVFAVRRGIEIERHGQRLAVPPDVLRQAEMDGPAFLSDEHGAGEQIARAVRSEERRVGKGDRTW